MARICLSHWRHIHLQQGSMIPLHLSRDSSTTSNDIFEFTKDIRDIKYENKMRCNMPKHNQVTQYKTSADLIGIWVSVLIVPVPCRW